LNIGGKSLSLQERIPHMTEPHRKSPPQSPNRRRDDEAKTHSGPHADSRGYGGRDWLMALGVLPDTMRAQTEAWLSGQTEFLAGMQEMMSGRMARYQEGTAAALQSFERLCGCTDGAAALAAYREWLAGGMGFVMADLAALQAQAARMAQLSQRTLGAFSPLGPQDATD
jgi:hypothetical protein